MVFKGDLNKFMDSESFSPFGSTQPMNYFSSLIEMLCHPIVRDRPTHQERLLTILAGVLKDFLSHRVASQWPTNRTQTTTAFNSNWVVTSTTNPDSSNLITQVIFKIILIL